MSLAWFADCIAEGKVLPFAEYSISGRRRVGSNQNLFWHPVHNPRPPERRLVRDQRQTVKSRHGDIEAEPRRENNVYEKKSAEPLQEIQPEVNSPKKQSSAKPRPRKIMPFDDDDEDDDNGSSSFVHINHAEDEDEEDDLGIQPIPDDDQEVEDSILKTFRDTEDNDPSTPEAPLQTIPTMPLDPPSKNYTLPPQLDGTSDPQPTQARLTSAITALLTSHKSKAARLLSRTGTASSDGAGKGEGASPADSVDASATSASASAPIEAATTLPSAPPLLRKHRTLGRAPSNPSTLLSRNASGGSATSLPALPENAHGAIYEKDDLDALLHNSHHHKSGAETDENAGIFRPSQALSYEDPDAMESRKRVMASLGEEGREEGESRMRVEGLGVVRDKARVVEAEKRGTRSRTSRRSVKG